MFGDFPHDKRQRLEQQKSSLGVFLLLGLLFCVLMGHLIQHAEQNTENNMQTKRQAEK